MNEFFVGFGPGYIGTFGVLYFRHRHDLKVQIGNLPYELAWAIMVAVICAAVDYVANPVALKASMSYGCGVALGYLAAVLMMKSFR